MGEESKLSGNFIDYEYHSITTTCEMESIYTDGYENFGWVREESTVPQIKSGIVCM